MDAERQKPDERTRAALKAYLLGGRKDARRYPDDSYGFDHAGEWFTARYSLVNEIARELAAERKKQEPSS